MAASFMGRQSFFGHNSRLFITTKRMASMPIMSSMPGFPQLERSDSQIVAPIIPVSTLFIRLGRLVAMGRLTYAVCEPILEGSLAFARRFTRQQSLHADVLVEILPMYPMAVTNKTPMI